LTTTVGKAKVGVGVMVGVSVGGGVKVWVGVGVFVGVGVEVGVALGVGVKVFVGVFVGVGVCVHADAVMVACCSAEGPQEVSRRRQRNKVALVVFIARSSIKSLSLTCCKRPATDRA
jgi:hypothetical protein